MQFIKPDSNINFIDKRSIAFVISSLMIAVTMVTLLIHQGPKYGIDFAGGSLIQMEFKESVSLNDIKAGLKGMGLEQSTVQLFGEPQKNEFLVRTAKTMVSDTKFSKELATALQTSTGKEVTIRRVEMVGPKVGRDLREKALFAMFYALLFITIYISGRFELKWMVSAVMAVALIAAVLFFNLFINSIPFLIFIAVISALVLFWFLKLNYAMGAIVALIHDVTITVGIFSIMDKEFSLTIIAALLTIIGYSLNDTIVVFDRICENLRKHVKKSLGENINTSINETLNRTILTSMTTLIVVICLFILGGVIIHDFAFAMIIGVLVGTYSSIFVASPILLVLQQLEKKRISH